MAQQKENNEKEQSELSTPLLDMCLYVFSSSLFTRFVRRSLTLIQLKLIRKTAQNTTTNRTANSSPYPSLHCYYGLDGDDDDPFKVQQTLEPTERHFKCVEKAVGRYPVFFWDYKFSQMCVHGTKDARLAG